MIDKEPFDGTEYEDTGYTKARARYTTLPNGGHGKVFKIVDEDNNIIWKEQM